MKSYKNLKKTKTNKLNTKRKLIKVNYGIKETIDHIKNFLKSEELAIFKENDHVNFMTRMLAYYHNFHPIYPVNEISTRIQIKNAIDKAKPFLKKETSDIFIKKFEETLFTKRSFCRIFAKIFKNNNPKN